MAAAVAALKRSKFRDLFSVVQREAGKDWGFSREIFRRKSILICALFTMPFMIWLA
jgi:hypothetical protein